MRIYGLRVGRTGVEFSSRDDREKAILTFTKGSTVTIEDCEGRRYRESERGGFDTYERETNEQSMNCQVCKGVFSSDVCTKRTVPGKDYSGGFKDDKTEDRYLCDGCYAKWMDDKKVHDAKKVLQSAADAA